MSDNEALETRMDRAERDILELFKRSQTSADFQAETKVTLSYIKEALDGLIKEVKALTDKPKQRWDLIVATGISVVVSSIVGFIVFNTIGR